MNEKQYRHFMVDCETLGVIPNKNPVLQIAAVLFNSETFEPELDSEGNPISFEIFLPLADQFKLGRTPDAGTVKWWQGASKAKVAKVVFDGVSKAAPLKEQLVKFSDWIADQCELDRGYAESVFWAKPTLFDYPFIDGLFLESGIPSPFHFRKVVDVHSYIIGTFKSVHQATKYYPMSHHIAYESYWAAFQTIKNRSKKADDAHNASADCIFQLEWLKEAVLNCSHYVSDEGIQETLSRKD
ncbi:MAG: hypothetical protein [Bacteriophage sp.]|nr:MAG: hypothetical protein [Bacteriophage sp.]